MPDVITHFIEPLSKVFRSDMDLGAVTDTLTTALRNATDYQLGRAVAYITETRKKATFPLPGECIDIVRQMPATPPAQGGSSRPSKRSSITEPPFLTRARAVVAEYDGATAEQQRRIDEDTPGRIAQYRCMIDTWGEQSATG